MRESAILRGPAIVYARRPKMPPSVRALLRAVEKILRLIEFVLLCLRDEVDS